MDVLLMPPPPDGDQNRGHTIFGLYWTFFALSIIITIMRFYAHVSIRVVGWDDWLMLVAVLLLLGFIIPGTLMILDGGCRHLYFLLSSPGGIEQVITVTKLFYICWNVLIDVCLALLPVTLFWNFNMSVKKRIALSFLMSGGLLAAISGAIKTSKLPEANAVDVTWGTYDLLLWNGAETFLVILCGSIPALKPIYDMCLRRQQASSRALFSIPRRPTYRPKKSFPSLSTGDDSYVQLEPIQKHSARPTVMEVARPANIVGGSQSTGGNATTALHEPHRATGERTASEGAVGAHETEQSRVRWPAANAFRGGDMV
ncbi:hypothetical protein MMC34_004891 [Xylographa carneopallida]|nr:hypothetical protein [Xylographa carneopallida]